MKKIYLLLPILFILITGCETTKPKVNLTPLEIQSMQSRSYEHSKDIVFPSVMSVFQDLGYSINSADINTGLITAESAAERRNKLLLQELDAEGKSDSAFSSALGTLGGAIINGVFGLF